MAEHQAGRDQGPLSARDFSLHLAPGHFSFSLTQWASEPLSPPHLLAASFTSCPGSALSGEGKQELTGQEPLKLGLIFRLWEQ